VFLVELLVLGEEVRLDADLGFWEGEGFAPVVSLEHHLHQRLKEEPNLPLKLTVGPERCLLPVPDLAAVDAGLVLPEGGDARESMDRREDHLTARAIASFIWSHPRQHEPSASACLISS